MKAEAEAEAGALAATTLSPVLEVTLEVLYSCERCGVEDRRVVVRERRGEQEDVRDWVKYVVEEVCKDHFSLHACRASVLTCLKIPLPKKANFIGEASRQ